MARIKKKNQRWAGTLTQPRSFGQEGGQAIWITRGGDGITDKRGNSFWEEKGEGGCVGSPVEKLKSERGLSRVKHQKKTKHQRNALAREEVGSPKLRTET